ncbi:STAS domain-containing protein [Actinosynnema sp. NPDC053489]|uniref:STAS domain-containing protein n=1 Tax=Actinosynnema sp. NPDC053489 TaxID=3363916 RepID=UPI0037CA4C7B
MGEPSPILDIRVTRAGEIPVITVAGEVDMDTVPEVRATLAAELAGGPPALVLDLTDVGFFSSAGLSLLLDARRRVDALAVVATRRAVLRPIKVTAIASLLSVFGSVDEALAHVSPAGTAPNTRS